MLGLSPRPIAPSHRKYSSQQGGGYLIKSLRRHHSLRKFFSSFIIAWMVRTSLDARFMAMALLAYGGFLRFDECSNLRLKDVIEHSTYFELFIGRSKTDQLHKGAVVPIVKTGTVLCHGAYLAKYLALAKLVLPTSANGGDGFLFDNIQTGSKSQFICPGSELSYTRCREILLKKLADLQLDLNCFFLAQL